MDYEKLFQNACQKILQIPMDTKFCVKDLFLGVEWEQLKKGEKLYFGRYFKNMVENKKVEQVEFLKKAENNSAVYVKIKE